ncbi:hypothetical protein BHM03_00006646 [Ensete ventricosum]|nr:hypothetical protein BHM03_00006646 [Ensete ventricosum]
MGLTSTGRITSSFVMPPNGVVSVSVGASVSALRSTVSGKLSEVRPVHRVVLSSVSKVSIGEAIDCEYNALCNRRGPWPRVFDLSGCRGSHPPSPRADVSKLIGRDDVATDTALDLAWGSGWGGLYYDIRVKTGIHLLYYGWRDLTSLSTIRAGELDLRKSLGAGSSLRLVRAGVLGNLSGSITCIAKDQNKICFPHSPLKMVETESPLKLVKIESPLEVVEAESPLMLVGTESPLKLVEIGSLLETIGTESPLETIGTESLLKLVETESPLETVEAESPLELVGTRSPLKLVRTKSQLETARTESLLKLVGIEISLTLVGTENPLKMCFVLRVGWEMPWLFQVAGI